MCERSDGLRYEGEWDNNAKHGHGVTTLPNGTREEGKYKLNVLVTPAAPPGARLVLLGAAKLRDRVQGAVAAALKAKLVAEQKSDIALSRYFLSGHTGTCSFFVKVKESLCSYSEHRRGAHLEVLKVFDKSVDLNIFVTWVC